MSHIISAIAGAAAVAFAFGAAQIASGNDLSSVAVAQPQSQADTVNRETKSDSLSATSVPAGATKTVSVALSGLSNTSVLIRIPAAMLRKEAVNTPPANPATSIVRKAQVACEPVVSVLTEVAKQLQPGRCIT